MKRAHNSFCILHSAFCIALAVALSAFASAAAGAPVAEDIDFTFSLDTRGGPFAVSSLAAAQTLPYRAGQSVAVETPGGTATTPVSSAASDGSYSWTPNAAGSWTLTNDGEGVAVFDVWYSLFPGASGGGTEADPAKAVDGGDLAALISGGAIGEGGCFTSGGALSAGRFAQPAGWAFVELGGGLYRLQTASGGIIFSGADAPLILDTVLPGPDRIMHKRESMPLAYAGDLWTGTNDATTATLSIAHATDGREDQSVTDRGTVPFTARRSGIYTITLADGLTELVGHINALEDGTYFMLR